MTCISLATATTTIPAATPASSTSATTFWTLVTGVSLSNALMLAAAATVLIGLILIVRKYCGSSVLTPPQSTSSLGSSSSAQSSSAPEQDSQKQAPPHVFREALAEAVCGKSTPTISGDPHKNLCGKGTLTIPEGSIFARCIGGPGTYEGEVDRWLPKAGPGTMIWKSHPTRSQFTGEWGADALPKRGLLTYRDGSLYEGCFKGNKWDGLGTWTRGQNPLFLQCDGLSIPVYVQECCCTWVKGGLPTSGEHPPSAGSSSSKRTANTPTATASVTIHYANGLMWEGAIDLKTWLPCGNGKLSYNGSTKSHLCDDPSNTPKLDEYTLAAPQTSEESAACEAQLTRLLSIATEGP